MQSNLTIGTRSSTLALIQAKQVQDMLYQIHGKNNLNIKIKTITTSGDKSQKDNLSISESVKRESVKRDKDNNIFGLFSKEIEQELLNGNIDIGVHSAKDMVSNLPNGLVMDIFLERNDPRDAFISLKYSSLENLPKGAIIGTSSVRRSAQVLRQRADLKIVEFRGNVDTRLKKLENNIADATILAVAGLNRLGKSKDITQILDANIFLPAPAQGAIAIEYRQNDKKTKQLITPLNHQETYHQIIAERSFLRQMDGTCRTPIGCLSTLFGNEILISAQVFSDSKKYMWQEKISGPIEQAEALGQKLADILLKNSLLNE